MRDTKTGLEWQRRVETASMGIAPATYCEQLTISGGGWRAPTLKELLTLVDPTRFDPAIDPQAFGSVTENCCRSANTTTSTNSLGPSVFAIAVIMRDGSSGGFADSLMVRCVR